MQTVFRRVVEGRSLSDADIRAIVRAGTAEGPERLEELLNLAGRLRERAFGDRAELCAIVNAKSGRCSEDCGFCAQSSRHRTAAPVYDFIGPEAVGQAAARAKAAGVSRFAAVISGKSPGPRAFEELKESVAAIRAQGLIPDLSPGALDEGRLRELRQAGLVGYHHNLETSRGFFPHICTTHDYEEDVESLRAARRAGLYVCAGGLFGLGESWDDRVDLALTLKDVGVPSVPVNFLNPIPGTPCGARPLLTPAEALTIIALLRFLLPKAAIRICGGRALILKDRRADVWRAGASGVMTGDYLTTQGVEPGADREELRRLGLRAE